MIPEENNRDCSSSFIDYCFACSGCCVRTKEKEKAVKKIEEYSANLELITYSLLSGAGDAETCGNLIKSLIQRNL